jgi:uncharacterized protein (TIGR03435 family)
LPLIAFSQTTPTPSFDVSEIRSSTPQTNPYMRGGAVRGGRYEVRDASMLDLIGAAYGMQSDMVQGGPAWLDTDRFDIAAKAPQGTTQENLNLMLQSLLADRFKLTVHKENKPVAAYALTVGKGKPKLKEAAGSGPSGCENQTAKAGPSDTPYNEFACRNMTMEGFDGILRGWAIPGSIQPIPIVDSTGLKGNWDFDIKWSTLPQRARGGSDAILLTDALDKQLGLKLELKKIPFPVIVVDSVNQKPTANAPDLATKLPPPPPAEFEVADVRPTAPDAQGGGVEIQNGRINIHGIPLKQLVMAAWDLNSEDLIAGAPKFSESARWDIVAKASINPKLAAEIDEATLRIMLRNLLIDRFKLAAHLEDRPVSAYTLSAVKPKLQKADPANRTNCHEGPGADGKDPRTTNPVLNRLMTCQNMTMAQFAEQLPNRVNGYVRTQVQDSTGLEGAFDFTISFSGVNLVSNAVKVGDNGNADPNGAVSLFDALSKQLGLKLELQKRNMQVLVVDHLEEKPTDN